MFISDESQSIPTHLQDDYLAIFKIHLQHEVPGTNIFPFNLGYVRDVPAYPYKPVDERGVNAFFSGNLNFNRLPLYRAAHPTYRKLPMAALRVAFALSVRGFAGRLMPADLSRALPDPYLRFTDGFKRGLSPTDYGKRLADSRVVLCPGGFLGAETFRHLEAIRAGAVVISEPLPDTHFYRGSPVVTVDDWETGLDRVRLLLEDHSALQEIQRATVSWWEDVCSEAATARYMHEKIRSVSS